MYTTYTIFCAILGETTPFPVDIASNKVVGHLKDAIKEKKFNRFAGVDADELTLYHVDIPDDDDLEKNVNKKINANPPLKLLRPTHRIKDIYPDSPPEQTVHILAKVPKTTLLGSKRKGPEPGTSSSDPPDNKKQKVQTPPNHPANLPQTQSPILGEEAINELIARFQPVIEIAIRTYLQNETELPIWHSQVGSEEVRDHIAGLAIPMTSTSSQSPSLLLHNLGQPSHDPHLAERVAKLFVKGFHQRYLCNTSGSGKTRLLLEGLWLYWGLYFTARTRSEGIGSSDLEEILEDLQTRQRSTPITGVNRQTALLGNQEVASRRFLLILYVRLFVFRIFLECAASMPGGITAKHKSHWLLLQLAPATLLGTPDVFAALTRQLISVSIGRLTWSIESALVRIRGLLGSQDLFCVLDEAQVPTEMFSDCSMSGTKQDTPRPILRHLVREWRPIFPNLILSGTGISMQKSETILGSAVAKENGAQPEIMTDLGAFDCKKDQRAYLEQYFPSGFLDSEPGNALAPRAAYWLHGRYRFTATWLSRLIRTGFQSPHQVLNHFVAGMTGFQPSDLDLDDTIEDDLPTPDPFPLERPHGFDFSKLQEDPALLRQIAGCVFDYIFNGKPSGLGGPGNDKLVEYGVARFGGLKDIITDEPIALLAVAHYFTTETKWPLQYFLANGLSHPYESARGTAFEQFGAYLLALAFKSPRHLSTVFDFAGDNDLEDEIGELVAVHKSGEQFVCSLVDITSNKLPTYILGRTQSADRETLSWLQDPKRTVFCFPPKDIGPDLILLLRLSDKSLLRVVVHFKQMNQNTINPKDTEEALHSTDPNSFISRVISSPTTTSSSAKGREKRKPLSFHIANPTRSKELQTAIGDLGPGTENAGELGVLRVLIAYPAVPHADTLTRIANADKSRHPVATVDVASLAVEPWEKQIVQSLKLRLEAAALQRKRKRDSHAEAPISKRPKP